LGDHANLQKQNKIINSVYLAKTDTIAYLVRARAKLEFKLAMHVRTIPKFSQQPNIVKCQKFQKTLPNFLSPPHTTLTLIKPNTI